MSPPDSLPFDLRALELFLAVCDAGSMAEAARRLGLTQPAMSQAVAEIERRTGVALFDRATRPLALTAAGALLRQRAGALLAEARQIGPMLRDTEHGRLPLVRAGLVDSLSRTLMAPLAGRLRRAADEVSLLSGLTSSHVSALLTRQLDLLVGAGDLDEIEGLERWPLLGEPYVLLLPADWPVPASPTDLAALAKRGPLVRYSARSHTGLEIERHLRRLRLEIPRRIEFDTPFGVTAAVVGGEGFAITTPLCLYEAGFPLQGFACHALPGPRLSRRLTLIARRHELGRLPSDLAVFCRARLAAQQNAIRTLAGMAGEGFVVEE
ncbi:LysR family transcriptional regulator [Ancylobacter sp. 6x-1]|uniref:LysR family transcriptional regulator n=1 Tax=Ancylobacter crimeensis TaxID=2579147 RepID=A0ABT0DG23_9HYPH|nr:LysR family transcriptional regulator [Ancylobacter crimeensis]MCK0198677.1 LysR family transcriptional regulator [Ancylobacter crimeensis]